MSEELNSSLDSLELELYHRPNKQMKHIVKYLKSLNLKFCTDPKQKQDEYFNQQKNKLEVSQEFGLKKNRFLCRKIKSQ